MEGQEGSNLVPTATNWSDLVGIMVTIHYGLISGLSWAPRAPKSASFGPERPFWESQRYLEGPKGPDLIPTVTDWSDWDGIMVTTHFGPVAGLSWAPRDTKKARFGSKCLLGPKKGPNRAKFQNCRKPIVLPIKICTRRPLGQ